MQEKSPVSPFCKGNEKGIYEVQEVGAMKKEHRLTFPESYPKTKTNPTWRDTIRRVVRQYKIFEPVPPERSGIYKLVEEVSIKAEAQSFTEKPEINHGIAQGMLVTLGKIYGCKTYAPPHDQTIRSFQGKPLIEIL